jgi:hypothetical protein
MALDCFFIIFLPERLNYWTFLFVTFILLFILYNKILEGELRQGLTM